MVLVATISLRYSIQRNIRTGKCVAGAVFPFAIPDIASRRFVLKISKKKRKKNNALQNIIANTRVLYPVPSRLLAQR